MIDRGEFTRKARSVALKVLGDYEKGRVFNSIEVASQLVHSYISFDLTQQALLEEPTS